jgi:hypothetical protein
VIIEVGVAVVGDVEVGEVITAVVVLVEVVEADETEPITQ